MTEESAEIVAMIDSCPEWVRRKMVESTAMVLEAYGCTVQKQPAVPRPARRDEEKPAAQVVMLKGWRPRAS